MSTKIEDLPGSNLEQNTNMQMEQMAYQQNQQNNMLQTLPQEILGDINSIKNETFTDRQFQQERENNSNIKVNVKKRVHFEDEKSEGEVENFKDIKEEINILSEENVLLLVLFLLSSQTDFDRYPKSIPFIGSYISNPLIFTVVKCLLLVVIYRLTEYFILPKISFL
jgi:hypothetical protein